MVWNQGVQIDDSKGDSVEDSEVGRRGDPEVLDEARRQGRQLQLGKALVTRSGGK